MIRVKYDDQTVELTQAFIDACKLLAMESIKSAR